MTILKVKADTNAPGPHMTLTRDSASPANNDRLGKIQFKGNDSAGNTIRYASIGVKIQDTTTGQDDSFGAKKFHRKDHQNKRKIHNKT